MRRARFLPALLLLLAASVPVRAIEFPCSEICTCARDCFQVCIGKRGNLTNCGSTGRCEGGPKCLSAASHASFLIPQERTAAVCALSTREPASRATVSPHP